MTIRGVLGRRLGSERAFALPLALAVTLFLGMGGATVMAYTTAGSQTASRSAAQQQALMLAEAGLNYAYSTLYSASSPTMPDAVPDRTVALEGGFARYYGVLDGNVWKLTGIGRVPNPTGPGADDIVRVVGAKVAVGSSRRGSANNAVWNYVYADDPTGCTTLRNGSEVNVPLYVRGSLCLENSAKVTGYALQVGGSLHVTGTYSSVGLPGSPVTEVHVAAGCTRRNGPLHSPCTAADEIYAGRITDAPTALTKPPVDLDYWYANAAPGPLRPCTVGSLSFDTNTTLDRSRASFNLTPNSAYDCRVYDSAGGLVGRITWTPGAPGLLEIEGTVFFDGDITMGQYATATYVGKGTLYTSGTFSIGQQSSLCGVATCDTAWDATANLLAIVAGAPTGDGITVSNYSVFQGAMYAVADYREGNNSQCWGPIIANQIYMQNSTLNHYVPIGVLLPGMPASYEDAVTLSNEPGSWG